MSGIVHVAPATSVGLRRFTEYLAEAQAAAGLEVAVLDADPRDGRHVHFHLGNSTRELLRQIECAPRPSVVTLHDVVPRTRLIRPLILPRVLRAIRPHAVQVTSRYAGELLAERGFAGGQPRVVPLCPPTHAPRPADVAAWRHRLGVAEGAPLLLSAGILKAGKGSAELVRAASEIVDAAASAGAIAPAFVFAGRAIDTETRTAIAAAGERVIAVGTDAGLPAEEFESLVAAADVLLAFRSDWVGEASGPTVEAHAWGTPVAGFASGSLPEYATEADRLFAPQVPLRDALRELVASTPFARTTPRPGFTAQHVATETVRAYEALGWIDA